MDRFQQMKEKQAAAAAADRSAWAVVVKEALFELYWA
jgi:hypothetical protein